MINREAGLLCPVSRDMANWGRDENEDNSLLLCCLHNVQKMMEIKSRNSAWKMLARWKTIYNHLRNIVRRFSNHVYKKIYIRRIPSTFHLVSLHRSVISTVLHSLCCFCSNVAIYWVHPNDVSVQGIGAQTFSTQRHNKEFDSVLLVLEPLSSLRSHFRDLCLWEHSCTLFRSLVWTLASFPAMSTLCALINAVKLWKLEGDYKIWVSI